MIHYSKSGEGNAIVLLHGFCENSTCFDQQVFFLKQDFCVITPDLPGVGYSELIENTSMEKMADEVFRILEKEKITSCIMLGHSMGGYVALAFAKKFSGMLKGFGLTHSTAKADDDERKIKRDQAKKVIEEKGVDFYVEQFVPPLFSTTFNDKKIIDELIAEGKRTTTAGLTAAVMAMKTRPESISFLQQTTIPALFIIGKNDLIIPDTDMFHQASLCKQAEIIYLKNAAHMGHIEEADLCAKAISDFSISKF
jgi:pimeloyl-ACP methyl ester carboxylesterase